MIKIITRNGILEIEDAEKLDIEFHSPVLNGEIIKEIRGATIRDLEIDGCFAKMNLVGECSFISVKEDERG